MIPSRFPVKTEGMIVRTARAEQLYIRRVRDMGIWIGSGIGFFAGIGFALVVGLMVAKHYGWPF